MGKLCRQAWSKHAGEMDTLPGKQRTQCPSRSSWRVGILTAVSLPGFRRLHMPESGGRDLHIERFGEGSWGQRASYSRLREANRRGERLDVGKTAASKVMWCLCPELSCSNSEEYVCGPFIREGDSREPSPRTDTSPWLPRQRIDISALSDEWVAFPSWVDLSEMR